MKRLVAPVILALLLGGTVVAEQHAKGKKHEKQVTDAQGAVEVHVLWAAHDVDVVRAHYAPRYRTLPPGLQKKYRRSGQLPPGWQKKMEPLPAAIERQCARLPSGYRRGVFDGHAVIYTPGGLIVDVAVLF